MRCHPNLSPSTSDPVPQHGTSLLVLPLPIPRRAPRPHKRNDEHDHNDNEYGHDDGGGVGVGGDGAHPGSESDSVKGFPVCVVGAESGIKVGGGGGDGILVVVVGEVVVDGVLKGCSSDWDGDNGTVRGRSSGGVGTVVVRGSGGSGGAFNHGVPVAERVLFRGRVRLWVDGFSGHGVGLLRVLEGISGGQDSGGSRDTGGGGVEMCVGWRQTEKE